MEKPGPMTGLFLFHSWYV